MKEITAANDPCVNLARVMNGVMVRPEIGRDHPIEMRSLMVFQTLDSLQNYIAEWWVMTALPQQSSSPCAPLEKQP